jgi:hypothetical protein
MLQYLISGGTTSFQIQFTHLLLSPSRCRHFSLWSKLFLFFITQSIQADEA